MTSSADASAAPSAVAATAGAALLTAVEGALGGWIHQTVAARVPAAALDHWADELRSVAGDTSERVVAELAALLALDFDQQPTSPLAVLRGVVGPLTALLEQMGAEPAVRDDAAAAMHPDDVFDLTPGAFADFGPDVGDAGLRWGAAKAFVHLRARAGSSAGEGS